MISIYSWTIESSITRDVRLPHPTLLADKLIFCIMRLVGVRRERPRMIIEKKSEAIFARGRRYTVRMHNHFHFHFRDVLPLRTQAPER
jgi:hypothetical protein